MVVHDHAPTVNVDSSCSFRGETKTGDREKITAALDRVRITLGGDDGSVLFLWEDRDENGLGILRFALIVRRNDATIMFVQPGPAFTFETMNQEIERLVDG